MFNQLINIIGFSPDENLFGFIACYCLICYAVFNILKFLYLLFGVEK